MAIRFQTTFVSEKGTSYQVSIYDDDYGSSSSDFTLTSFQVSYISEKDDERFSPVLVSEARIGILINTADLETFVTDLVDADEGRFYINVTNSSDFSWNGYILMDLVSYEDLPYDSVGYVFQLRAKDGLNRLKTIDYNNSGNPYTGYATFTDHILNCLNKIEFVSTIWPGGTDLLHVICNWHETSYTYSSTINPLDKSRVKHKAFFYVDNRANNIYKSCYDVLKEICTAWGARIMASGNGFWFVQLNELDNASSIVVFNYESDGTATNNTLDLTVTHNPNGANDIIRLSGGRWEFFRALKYVQVDYEHIATRNMSEIAGQVWTESAQPSITIEDVDQNAGVAKFRLSGKLQVTSDYLQTFDYGRPYHLIWIFTFQIGSYYLRRDLTWDGHIYTFGPAYWDSGGVYYYYYLLERPIRTDPETVAYDIEIVTPGISTDNDLLFTMAYSQGRWADDGTVVNAIDLDVDYTFSEVYMEYIYDGTFDQQNDILRYKSTNNGTASLDVELKTLVGDGPNSVTPGHIEIENDAAAWVLSDGWRVGNSGVTKAHSQLLCNEIVKGQLTPVKKFANMKFQMVDETSIPLPHKPIVYNSAQWVFQRGIWDINTAIWSGTWWKIQSAAGYTEETVEELLEGSEDGPPTNGGAGGTTGGGGSTEVGNTVRQYIEVFSATGSSDTFTVTKNSAVIQGDENSIMVFRNGQYLSETYINSIDGPNGQVQLTFTPASGEEIVIVWIVIQ